ncbi:hypothetical protein BDW62DRAFT_192121 [Aspergillus aurantiobrunneus]
MKLTRYQRLLHNLKLFGAKLIIEFEEYATKDQCRTWIKDYTAEEERCAAMLHRLRRLQQLDPTDTASIDNEQLEEEKAQLRSDCILNPRALEFYLKRKPSGGKIIEFDLHRRTKDEQGRSAAWYAQRLKCAERGGCCGRTCGCCESPIREYFVPGDGEGERQGSGVYSHCTTECGCCIQNQGCYFEDLSLKLPRSKIGPGVPTRTAEWLVSRPSSGTTMISRR